MGGYERARVAPVIMSDIEDQTIALDLSSLRVVSVPILKTGTPTH